MKNMCLAAVSISLLCMATKGGALEMPREISNVHLGMDIVELLKIRPSIKAGPSLPITPEKMQVGRFMLQESLDGDGYFLFANYGVEDGRVSTIVLIGNSPRGQEKELRKRVFKDCVQRWGKKFVKHAPEDKSRPGVAQVMIAWEFEGVEIVLSLPRTRKQDEKRPYHLSLAFRPASAIEQYPWKESKMTNSERKDLFKANDIDE